MVAAVETMAYVGQTPWHGLGNRVDPNISLEEFQKQAGLDWSVSKRPVMFHAPDGVTRTEFGGVPLATFKDKFVLSRDSDNRPFSVVSGRYKPVQPKEIFAFFKDLLGMYGMKMHTAGSLKDGGRIWCLAETGDVHKVLNVDKVESYLLLATSYDLTMSTIAQFTSVRVVCNNTLQAAMGDKTGRITLPHMKDFDEKEIKAQLGIGREQWQAFGAMLDSLAKVKLDTVTASRIIDNVFKLPRETELRLANSDHVHADNVIRLFQHQNYIGADLAGDSAWGLLNCVTEYVDFHKRARGQGNRLDSAWFGEGANIKDRAVTALLAA